MLSCEMLDYLDSRFKCGFKVACFSSIDEVDTKPLSYQNEIIFRHDSEHSNLNRKGKHSYYSTSYDYYIIKRQESQECIRICDIIDFIIEKQLLIDPEYSTLHSIGISNNSIDPNSTPVYGVRWEE